MIDFLLFLIPAYIIVSIKYYNAFKKTGLLEPDKSREYYFYIFFWPYFKLTETNPFEKIAELVFKNYGEKGVSYMGWGGLRNVYNDLAKGKHRYKNTKVFVLRFELKKPLKDSFFKSSKFVKLLITKQNKKYTYFCSLSDENFKDDSWSSYGVIRHPNRATQNHLNGAT